MRPDKNGFYPDMKIPSQDEESNPLAAYQEAIDTLDAMTRRLQTVSRAFATVGNSAMSNELDEIAREIRLSITAINEHTNAELTRSVERASQSSLNMLNLAIVMATKGDS